METIEEIKELILEKMETFDEARLHKLFEVVNALSHEDKVTVWTEEYKTQVLGNWQGELKREDSFPETRITW